MERHLVEGVKDQYYDGMRTVQDKLGAHYQQADGNTSLYGLNILTMPIQPVWLTLSKMCNCK